MPNDRERSERSGGLADVSRPVGLLACLLVLTACGDQSPSGPDDDSGVPEGRIVFARDSLGATALASARPDGSDLQFIRGPVAESFQNLDFSHDWSRVVVVPGRNVRVLDADGNVVGETAWPDGAWFDDLSPDGERLLWWRFDVGQSAYEIYTTDPDGSDIRTVRLFPEADYEYVKASHYLSAPASTRIVFVGLTSEHGAEIYSMDTAGSDLQRLTDTDDGKDFPVPSPDGGRIAYVTFRTLESVSAGGGASVVLMGSSDFQADSNVDEVAWSWDGSTVVAYVESSNPGFWAVSRGGGDARRITEGGPFHYGYAVSPDGSQIVVSDADKDLVLIDVETGERELLLGETDLIAETDPIWLPE